MGEKWPIQFCLQHATSTVSVGIFYVPTNLRHGTDGFTSPPKEGMLRIFFARKIRPLQPGLNSRTRVPEASILTTRPLKTRYILLLYQPTA